MKIRWGWAAVAVVPVLVWMSAAAMGGGADGGGSRTLAAVVGDPLSFLAKRSPGGRGAGALLSTKPHRAAVGAAAAPPAQRVLGRVRERPPIIPPLEGVAPMAAAPSDMGPLASIAQPGVTPGGATPVFGGPPMGEPGLPYTGPDGGGPTPTLPGTPEVPVVPVVPIVPGVPVLPPVVPVVPVVPVEPVVPGGPPDRPVTPIPPVVPVIPGGPVSPPTPSAVPEPASWVIMLVGFFTVGWSIRRSGARRLSHRPS